MNGGFSGQLAEAFKPHVGVIGGQIKSSQDRVIYLLEKLLEAQIQATKNQGVTEFGDYWQYCSFSFSAAQATPIDFMNPIVVPKNEIWLVQNVQLSAAQTVTIQTDGGQFRGIFALAGTFGVGGDVAWLPGEHIVISSAGAVTGTVGVVRRTNLSSRRGFLSPSNELVAGRFNTHSEARDNLDQRGIYVEEMPEVRPTEGLERNLEPVVALASVPPGLNPRRSIKSIPADEVDPTV